MNDKLPIRQCLACRQRFRRDQLIRLLRDHTSGQVFISFPSLTGQVIDTTFVGISETTSPTSSHQFGRSVYLCPSQACVLQVLKGKRLAKTLKTAIPDDILKTLSATLKGPCSDCSQQSSNL